MTGDGTARSDAWTEPEIPAARRAGISPAARRGELQRVEWLMLVRVLVLLALLAAMGWISWNDGGELQRVRPVSLGLGFAFLVSLGYGVLARRLPNLEFFTFLQLGLDSLAIGFVVLVTGGIESPFRLLFVFNILAGGVLLGLRAGLLVATFDTAVFVAISLLEWFHWLPGWGVRAEEFRAEPSSAIWTYSTVALHVVAFYLLAFLAGSLARMQQETGQALAETEDSLSRLRDMHGRIVQNIDAGLLTVDREGRITSFNRAAEKITRHSSLDVVGRQLEDVLSGLAPVIAGAGGSGASLPPGSLRERWATRKDGRRVYLRVASSVLRTTDGRVEGLIYVFEDRTKLIRMEEQLQRDERLAAVGRLAAGIAHEIRNPLASIRGSAQVLRRGLDLHDEDGELLGIIEREADRLGRLVSDFLSMTREERPNRSPGKLGGAIRETLQLAASRGLGTLVKTEVDVAYDPVFPLDQERIRQLLWNLVNNALQAMANGGTLSIRTARVSAEDVGQLDAPNAVPTAAPTWQDAILLVIADTGHGIREEALERIFDPFYTTRSGGTGLGLAIARRVVEAHGGVIAAESAVGKGTRFRIWLPVVRADEVVRPMESAS